MTAFPRACRVARLALLATLAAGVALGTENPSAGLEIRADAPDRLEFVTGGEVAFRPPSEGLWSVATDWRDDWPADWHHTRPEHIERQGEWTVATGHLELAGGVLELRDAYRREGGLIRGVRRFTWRSQAVLPNCTLAIRWQAPGSAGARPVLPGISYYGNPSGVRTGAGAVPRHTGAPGDESIYEEHRYAAPWAYAEWPAGGAARGAALHVLPSPVAGGHLRDQWWSLGVVSRADSTEFVSWTGPICSNGRRSVAKALQKEFLPYPDARVDLAPGAVVEKTFFLEAVPTARAGDGFRASLRTGFGLHPEVFSAAGLPSYDGTLRAKYRFALSRYRADERQAGFEMFPDFIKGTHYVMGWCGQAEAAGYAMLGLAGRLGDPAMVERGVRCLDLLARAPFNEKGFLLRYTAEAGAWTEQDFVSQGQAMENFFRAIHAAEGRPGADVRPWRDFLRRACSLHAERILRDDWRPVSTGEAFLVSPLCRAAAVFGDERCRAAALKAVRHCAARHLGPDEPYWGGTLDAQCEDKEGAWAGFQAFLAAYEMTRDPQYLAWAEHALDVVLTYVVAWDIDLPPGRLRDHALKTRGWTIVSAQNQHLDMFGVLFTPEIWRMGGYLGRDDLRRLAAVMYRTCGQLVDDAGSQGEQIQHTNFGQQGELKDVLRLRGGYSESWTVFWITAHFLNAAAEFERMGVDLDRVEESIARSPRGPLR